MKKQYKNLKEFYPYYLLEHQDKTSRSLHFVGTSLFLTLTVYALIFGPLWLLAIAPVSAYGFAWIGHFFFEKNTPATFQYPGLSMVSDFKMFWDIITFQLPKKMTQAMKTTSTKNVD